MEHWKIPLILLQHEMENKMQYGCKVVYQFLLAWYNYGMDLFMADKKTFVSKQNILSISPLLKEFDVHSPSEAGDNSIWKLQK